MINSISGKNELISKIQDLRSQTPVIKANSFKDKVSNTDSLKLKTLLDDKKEESPIKVKAQSFIEQLTLSSASNFKSNDNEVNEFTFVDKKDHIDLRSVYMQEEINSLIEKAEELESQLSLEIDNPESSAIVQLLVKFREIITKLDEELRVLKNKGLKEKSIDNKYLSSVNDNSTRNDFSNNLRNSINENNVDNTKELKKPLFKKPTFNK